VMQSANPAANAAANALANAAANAPSNVANNAANAANTQANAAANPGQNAGAQPPPVQANHAEGNQRRHIRDDVLTTTAIVGSPTPLMPTTPSKQQSCGTCMTKSFCNVHSTTKTTALPMTFTSSRWHTPRRQARVRSTTSLRSHDVRTIRYPKDFKPAIEKYDGRSDPSIWLKMYSIATRASGGNEDHMAGYFPHSCGSAISQ
jgi:hypothetical protein